MSTDAASGDGQERGPVTALVLCLLAVIVASVAAPRLFQENAVGLALAAIVVAGLPHGTLDIKAIQDSARLGSRATLAALALYLVLAAGMAAIWLVAPLAALVAFIAIGAVHFSEDWAVRRLPWLGVAVPLAFFSAGAVRDRSPYDAIFAALAGDPRAMAVTDLLITLSPVAHAAALVAALAWLRNGQARRALAAVICIAGMWLFTPVVGFAIYFVAYHSPMHVREVFGIVKGPVLRLAAEGLATFALAGTAILLLGTLRPDPTGFSAIGTSVFIMLSVLTVPHMLAPRLVQLALKRRQVPF